MRQARRRLPTPRVVKLGMLVALIFILLGGIVSWRMATRQSLSLEKTYCSVLGRTCFSYPRSWQLDRLGQQVRLRDPKTGTIVGYSSQADTLTGVCDLGNCLFKTLSIGAAVGLPGNDIVTGVFQNKEVPAPNVSPICTLLSTSQVHRYGLTIGQTTDIRSSFAPYFVNQTAPTLQQDLIVVPDWPPSIADTPATAQQWLQTTAAQIAKAIISSVRSE